MKRVINNLLNVILNPTVIQKEEVRRLMNLLNSTVTPRESTQVDNRWNLLNGSVIPKSLKSDLGISFLFKQIPCLAGRKGISFSKVVNQIWRSPARPVGGIAPLYSALNDIRVSFRKNLTKATESAYRIGRKSFFIPLIDSSSVFVSQFSVGMTKKRKPVIPWRRNDEQGISSLIKQIPASTPLRRNDVKGGMTTTKNPLFIIINLSFIILLSAVSVEGFSQAVSINPTGADPDPSAMLDVSDTTKGFLPPRMSTANMNAISSPAAGLFIYNTDSAGYFFYNGSNWISFGAGTSAAYDTLEANVFGAKIENNSGTVTLISQSADFIQSVTNPGGTGWVRVDFKSGFFAEPPAAAASAANININASVTGSSTSSVTIRTSNNSGTYINTDVSLVVVRQGLDFRYNTNQTTNQGPVAASQLPAEVLDSTRLADADNDTKIQVEESADEDVIRFDIAGNERFIFYDSRIEQIGTGFSTYYGRFAGQNDDFTNNSNTGFGYNALSNLSSGSLNVAVGFVSLGSSTIASNNVSIGYQAMYNNLAGGENVAVGNFALLENTSGKNTAVGLGASQRNTSGNNNVSIGYNANSFNQAGSYNTIIGVEAGEVGVTHNKSRNVLIGYRAGYNNTASQRLYLHNDSSMHNSLLYGEFDNQLLRVNGQLQIGNSSGPGVVYSFPTTDGSGNEVLFSDGSGQLNFGNVRSLYGEASLNDTLGLHLMKANLVTDGNWISGDGDSEGLYVNNSGRVSVGTAIPLGKLHVDNSGGDVAIMTSSSDAEIGYVTGTDFEIVGVNGSTGSIEERNFIMTGGRIGIGTSSPNSKLDVEDTTSTVLRVSSFGKTLAQASALNLLKARGNSGSPATVVNAGTVGKINAFAHDGSSYTNSAKIQFEIDGTPGVGDMPGRIQFHTTADGANITTERMRIDNAGNVGIGTPTPTHLLDVNGTGRFTSNLDVEQEFGVRTPSGGNYLIFKGVNNTEWTVTTAGTSAPVTLNFDAIGTFTTYFDGSVFVNGSTPVTSDSSFKTEVTPLTNVLQKLELLEGVSYFWDTLNFADRNFSQTQDIGLIAQKLQRIYPQLVMQREDGYLAVDYSKFTAVLLQAIKEQQAIINAQGRRLSEVEAKLENAEAQNETQNQRLIQLENWMESQNQKTQTNPNE